MYNNNTAVGDDTTQGAIQTMSLCEGRCGIKVTLLCLTCCILSVHHNNSFTLWSFTLHLKRWPCLPCLIFILCVHIFCASLALTQYKGDPSWHSSIRGLCLARTLCVYSVLVYKYRNSPPLYRLPSSLLFRNQFLCCLARRQIAKHPLYLSNTNTNTNANANANANTKLQMNKHNQLYIVWSHFSVPYFRILINPCWLCIMDDSFLQLIFELSGALQKGYSRFVAALHDFLLKFFPKMVTDFHIVS